MMKAFNEWWVNDGCTVEELQGAEKGWRAALRWVAGLANANPCDKEAPMSAVFKELDETQQG